MFGKLIGEVLASPARVVEGACRVTGNVADAVLGDEFGVGDVMRVPADAAESVGDAVSDGISETLDD